MYSAKQKKGVCVSEEEYRILKKFLSPQKINEDDNDNFLINELAEEGLIRLGTNFKDWCGTARTTELGRRMIGE
ncbi:MAG: hypothetical protein CVT88_00635 [Candidatus Altiarchaeales archaeon HGW-Altiarchaeales-1]|nr:MAG: hypothetical protein CVT89_01630 [Candidatus Altiarchaeales archaeon HGW-Altiarchaeales-2]PKP61260.1 MAG: hypothetical protein CVT88_00635 [Candidatus Altiarchaeales archaeon HGW-Altiarchaeales-1]